MCAVKDTAVLQAGRRAFAADETAPLIRRQHHKEQAAQKAQRPGKGGLHEESNHQN